MDMSTPENSYTRVDPSYSVKLDPDTHALLMRLKNEEIRTISGMITVCVLQYASQKYGTSTQRLRRTSRKGSLES